MRLIARMTVGIMLVWLPACASDKAELREPLAVGSTVPRAVTEHNNQGIQDYKVSRYQEAKTNFQRAVTGAPDSAEAHYNLALALFALGESSEAREHFLHAADLAPPDSWCRPRARLASYSRPLIEGSPEWEVLYRKTFEEELLRRKKP